MRVDWVEAKNDDIAKLIRGITYKKNQILKIKRKGYLPVLRANNINRILNFEDLVFVEKHLVKDEQFIKKGDILFSMSSGSKHLVGKSAQAKKDFQGGYGAFCALLRVNKTILNKYISYYFKTNKFRQIVSKSSKGTNINNLKRSHLLDLIIPLSPIPEQRAIVNKIETLFKDLDSGINHLKTAQTQLKTYRQAVLKKAFDGDWDITTVGELFDFVGGGTPSKQNNDYWNGNIPWASVKDIKGIFLNSTQNFISKKGFENSSANLAKKGEVILITRISPGKVLVTNIETAINQDLKIIRPKKEFLNRYICYLFKSIEKECIKLSSGTTVLGINLTQLKSIKIPIIKKKEQTQIVKEIETRLGACDKTEKLITESLTKAEHLRQSILKKAFEGELLSDVELVECKKAKDYLPASELLKQIKAEKITAIKKKRSKNDQ